ncbi:hypothetical protein chiPu_0022859, partial [Chiloscyllium punctatum]|nr:hypothetical protein [Chiloscyllium punctatum]
NFKASQSKRRCIFSYSFVAAKNISFFLLLLEYGGKWKMLHYFARNFFASVLPVAFEEHGTLFIYGVSDLPSDLKVMLQVKVYQWNLMEPVCVYATESFILKARTSAPVYKEITDNLLRRCDCSRYNCVVTFYLKENGTQLGPSNYYLLSSLKDAQMLRKPQVNVSNNIMPS